MSATHEHPRFVCAREGHKPTLTKLKISGVTAGSAICSCQRCGTFIEVKAA